jgi:hypothetical protein
MIATRSFHSFTVFGVFLANHPLFCSSSPLYHFTACIQSYFTCYWARSSASCVKPFVHTLEMSETLAKWEWVVQARHLKWPNSAWCLTIRESLAWTSPGTREQNVYVCNRSSSGWFSILPGTLIRNQSLRVVMLTLWTMSQAKGETLVRVVLGILLFSHAERLVGGPKPLYSLHPQNHSEVFFARF